jgi:hypothetical protein
LAVVITGCVFSVLAGNSLPDIVHAKATPPGRIIVVGDVHGCLEELQVNADEPARNACLSILEDDF